MEPKTTATLSGIRLLMLDLHGDYINWGKHLKRTGRQWDVTRVEDTHSLAAHLESSHYDVLLVANSAKEYEALTALRRALEVSPDTLRFQLGITVETPKSLAQKMEILHRVFPKPGDIEAIASSIEYLIKISRLISRPALRQFISKENKLPAAPGIYRDLTQALNDETNDASRIAAIIERDPALSAKVIQLVNSSFFGFARQISHISEAVSIIGTRMLRGLALATQVADLYPPHPRWQYFSFAQVNERALLVARLARDICKDARAEKAVADQAFLSGLLNDIGLLVMISQDPEGYLKALQYAIREQKPLHVAEKNVLGLYHGEVGAALLALWNIPALTVESVLFHAAPHLSQETGFCPLLAVHVADALLPPVWQHKDTQLNSPLSEKFLEQTGQAKNLHRWKLMALEYKRLLTPAARAANA